jgi:hypothetical protein
MEECPWYPGCQEKKSVALKSFTRYGAVVDPLRCIDIWPAWQLAMESVMLLGTIDRERDSDEEMTFH